MTRSVVSMATSLASGVECETQVCPLLSMAMGKRSSDPKSQQQNQSSTCEFECSPRSPRRSSSAALTRQACRRSTPFSLMFKVDFMYDANRSSRLSESWSQLVIPQAKNKMLVGQSPSPSALARLRPRLIGNAGSSRTHISFRTVQLGHGR